MVQCYRAAMDRDPGTKTPRRTVAGAEGATLVGISPGTVVGTVYRLEAPLGAGAFGEVWRARHLGFDRDVALKLPPRDLVGEPTAAQRFLREAQKLMDLEHPGICRVRNCGIDTATPGGALAFIEMELLEGPTLDEFLADQAPLGLEAALAILAPLAEALDHAHSQNLVHRDLKPGNVIFTAPVDRGGRPLLIDFGIAAEIERAMEKSGATMGGRAEAVAGTPSYMSPEQILGRRARPSMDVWALAVLAYQMLADDLPFPGPASERRNQILHLAPEPIRIEGVPAAVSDRVSRVLVDLLSTKEPEARSGSASGLVAALAAAAADEPRAPVEPRETPRYPPPDPGPARTSPRAPLPPWRLPPEATAPPAPHAGPLGLDPGNGTLRLAVCATVRGAPRAELVPLAPHGNLPAWVALQESGAFLVGGAARDYALTHPARAAFGLGRLLGRTAAEVGDSMRYRPFDLVPGPSGECLVVLGDHRFSPEDLWAVLRDTAVRTLAGSGGRLTPGIWLDPAGSTPGPRMRLDLPAPRWPDDPVTHAPLRRILSPAVAVAVRQAPGLTGVGLVLDLGSGALDVAVVEFTPEVVEVRARRGDRDLGGDDWTARLVAELGRRIRAEHGADPQGDGAARQRLWHAAEDAKLALSTRERAEIDLPYLLAGPGAPLHFRGVVTRSQFEGLVRDLTDRVASRAREALEAALVNASDVRHLVLAGGATAVPSVRARLAALLPAARTIQAGADAAVLGAATAAGILDGKVSDFLVLDVAPFGLSLSRPGSGRILELRRDTTLPTVCEGRLEGFGPNGGILEVGYGTGGETRSLGRLQVPAGPWERLELSVETGGRTLVRVRPAQGASATDPGWEVLGTGFTRVAPRDGAFPSLVPTR